MRKIKQQIALILLNKKFTFSTSYKQSYLNNINTLCLKVVICDDKQKIRSIIESASV